MGRYAGNNRQEMGFPDEFGVDMCQEEQEQPQPQIGPITPFCGYVTPTWFGPFLLSPHSRRGRGFS